MLRMCYISYISVWYATLLQILDNVLFCCSSLSNLTKNEKCSNYLLPVCSPCSYNVTMPLHFEDGKNPTSSSGGESHINYQTIFCQLCFWIGRVSQFCNSKLASQSALLHFTLKIGQIICVKFASRYMPINSSICMRHWDIQYLQIVKNYSSEISFFPSLYLNSFREINCGPLLQAINAWSF